MGDVPVVVLAPLAALLLLLLLRLERRGDSVTTLNLVLAALLADAALFPRAGTANGVLLPSVGPLDVPLTFLLVPVVLALRTLVRTPAPRATAAGLAWAAFLAWTAVAALAGLLTGNDSHAVVDQVKVFVYVGGTALLVAGVPLADLAGPRGIARLLRWTAPVVLLLAGAHLFGITSSADLGLLRLAGTGALGADFATAVVTLGVLGLALARSGEDPRWRSAVPAAICLGAPLFTGQRASLLAMVVSVAVLAGVAAVLRGHAGLTLGRSAVPTVLVGALVLAAALSVTHLLDRTPSLGGTSLAQSFTSQGKLDSVQSRVNQWEQAWSLVAQQPWLGHGLGQKYTYTEVVDEAPDLTVTSPLTHNVFLDQLLRTGIVGAAALALALGLTAAAGVRAAAAWRTPDAALALGATAALVGLVARGAVESVLEKPRLAVLLGLLVGLVSLVTRVQRERDWRGSPPSAYRLSGVLDVRPAPTRHLQEVQAPA